MTIAEELKALIVKRGGSAAGVQTIAQAVRVLTSLEEADESDESDNS